MSLKPASFPLAPRFFVAALLLAAAALTGCNAAPADFSTQNLPSLLGTSRFNGEPVSTLGATYSLPNTHHRAQAGQTVTHPYHRAL